MATRRAHHPRQGFTACPIPANMTVEASHPRFARPERRHRAGIRDHPLDRHLNGIDVVSGDNAPTLDHGNTIGDTAVSQAYAAGSILAIKLSGTGSITGQGSVLTIVLWCNGDRR